MYKPRGLWLTGKQKVSGTEKRLSCINVPETGSRHLICLLTPYLLNILYYVNDYVCSCLMLEHDGPYIVFSVLMLILGEQFGL